MVKIEFYPFEIDYKTSDEGPYVQLYGKTKEGFQLCVQHPGFFPYLYVFSEKENVEDLNSRLSSLEIQKKDGPVRILKTEIVEKRKLGKRVRCIKLSTRYPADISAIRSAILEKIDGCRVFDSDIPYVRKYLLDKQVTPLSLTEAEGDFVNQKYKVSFFEAKSIEQNSAETIDHPKILSFDLETYKPRAGPSNPEENPLLMISFTSDGFFKTIICQKFDTQDEKIEFVENEF
jgi:DNA polymerase I